MVISTLVGDLQVAIEKLGFSTVLSCFLLFFIYRLIGVDIRRIEKILEKISDNLENLADKISNP